MYSCMFESIDAGDLFAEPGCSERFMAEELNSIMQLGQEIMQGRHIGIAWQIISQPFIFSIPYLYMRQETYLKPLRGAFKGDGQLGQH